MWDKLLQDPTLPEITIVMLLLVGVALLQKLQKAAVGIGIVFIIYVGFILLNSDVKTTQKKNKHSPVKPMTEIVDNIPLSPPGKKSEENVGISHEFPASEIGFSMQSQLSQKLKSKPNLPIKNSDKSSSIKKATPGIEKKIQHLKVNSIVTCADVMIRDPIGVDSVFINTMDRIYCVTGVRNLSEEATIFHKWYYEKSLRSKIKINMQWSHNWRSWSYVTLNPKLVGTWEVVITDTLNTLLDAITFTVVAADSTP